jgi:hypothetical protein
MVVVVTAAVDKLLVPSSSRHQEAEDEVLNVAFEAQMVGLQASDDQSSWVAGELHRGSQAEPSSDL